MAVAATGGAVFVQKMLTLEVKIRDIKEALSNKKFQLAERKIAAFLIDPAYASVRNGICVTQFGQKVMYEVVEELRIAVRTQLWLSSMYLVDCLSKMVSLIKAS